MGVTESNGWTWKLHWTGALSAMEAESELDLLNILIQVRPSIDCPNMRRWIPSSVGFFPVKSAYTSLQDRTTVDNLDDNKLFFLKRLWKNNVPSKVSIFGWRMLIEKLPTRATLHHIGVITNNIEKCCVLCSHSVESENHIFLNCCVMNDIWRAVFKWMGTQILAAGTVQEHLLLFGDIVKGKKCKGVKHIIWLATTWCIWRTPNNVLFRENLP
jgi:hypothetical protein